MCAQRDAVLSEPAIQVRRRCRGKQIWSLEKMENRLVDMRELYQEWQDYHVHHQDDPVSPTPPLTTECEKSLSQNVIILLCLFFSFAGNALIFSPGRPVFRRAGKPQSDWRGQRLPLLPLLRREAAIRSAHHQSERRGGWSLAFFFIFSLLLFFELLFLGYSSL